MIKVWLLRITGGYSYHLYTAPRWQTTPALTMSRVLGALLKIILRTICSIRERTMRITRHHTHTTIYFPDQLASSGADLIQLSLICFNSTKATVISLLQPCFGCHVMPTPINIDICLHCLWLSSSFLSSQFISLFQHKSWERCLAPI